MILNCSVYNERKLETMLNADRTKDTLSGLLLGKRDPKPLLGQTCFSSFLIIGYSNKDLVIES